MRKLKLVGLSDDGHRVRFVDAAGEEFTAPADERLRAALRGEGARPGQLEIEMESALRPRDIQARIRAGDSPETVASLAQVPVERIMAYCLPVLAERQHVTEIARRSHVRRKDVDGPSRGLADLVSERLRGRGVDPATAVWDAWRRPDGRWTVQASYLSGERERNACFAFDTTGRYSVAEDDEARWLTGERQSSSHGPQPRETGRGSERRLTAVPSSDGLLTLPDEESSEPTDAPSVDAPPDAEPTDDLTAVVRAVSDDAESAEPTPDAAIADTAEAADESPPKAERKRRGKRASVPSWDEIMFGKGDKD